MMRSCLYGAALTCFAAAAGFAAASESDGSAVGNRLFFLAEERLVLIELRIVVDQKPLVASWSAFLDHQFRAADADRNGVLSGDELNCILTPAQLEAFGILPRTSPRVTPESLAGGKLTRQELGEYYDRIGLELLSLPAAPPADAYFRSAGAETAESVDANSAASVLFRRLDVDDNQRLTVGELRAAALALRKYDLDRDGSISTSELSPVRRGRMLSGEFMAPPNVVRPRILTITRDRPARTLVAELLAAYDRPQRGQSQPDSRLSAREIGLPAESFARADMDEDGQLDFEELQQFLTSATPEVTLVVRLGQRLSKQPAVEVRSADGTSSSDAAVYRVGSTQLELTLEDNYWADQTSAWRQAFQNLDRDANGYLDAAEMKAPGVDETPLTAVDADRDGLVYEKEMLAVLEPVTLLNRNRVRLQASDLGRDLFRLLDSGGDGRIGLRDFRAAADRMPRLDANGDEELERGEIPRNVQLRVARGRLEALGASDSLGSFTDSSRGVGVFQRAPEWFVRMDCNNDGDVSANEFLGPLETFASFDSDGDGLLDAREAGAAKAP